jgi:hypothetical protein
MSLQATFYIILESRRLIRKCVVKLEEKNILVFTKMFMVISPKHYVFLCTLLI